jgi:hypothetical protein
LSWPRSILGCVALIEEEEEDDEEDIFNMRWGQKSPYRKSYRNNGISLP